jgi:hypothetical protein
MEHDFYRIVRLADAMELHLDPLGGIAGDMFIAAVLRDPDDLDGVSDHVGGALRCSNDFLGMGQHPEGGNGMIVPTPYRIFTLSPRERGEKGKGCNAMYGYRGLCDSTSQGRARPR